MICSQPITVAAAKINKIHIENRTYSVPCGVCAICKQNRVQEWVFRLKEEQKNSFETDFVTFTYTDENMPMVWSDYLNTSVGTLNPDDLKNFWKRLRKSLWKTSDERGETLLKYVIPRKTKKNPKPKLKTVKDYQTKIKYYACGEYGEQSWRPHYHAIIFNLPTDPIEKRDLLWKVWALGSVHISPEETGPNALAYTAKYIDKVDFMHSDDVRIKKFSRMSHGLGKSYLTPEIIKYHRDNPLDRNFVTTGYTSGSKQKMPRYYRQKIYSKVDRYAQAQQIQKEKLEKESEYKDWFKAEKEQKEHAHNKYITSLKRNKRDGIQNLES